jgi:hypothetical protein
VFLHPRRSRNLFNIHERLEDVDRIVEGEVNDFVLAGMATRRSPLLRGNGEIETSMAWWIGNGSCPRGVVGVRVVAGLSGAGVE